MTNAINSIYVSFWSYEHEAIYRASTVAIFPVVRSIPKKFDMGDAIQ
jgi:hypothetical protein